MTARGYRFLGWVVLVAYPVVGVSYLFNIDGAVVEAVFFAAFTVMVLLQLYERLPRRKPGRNELSPDDNPGMMSRWEPTASQDAPR